MVTKLVGLKLEATEAADLKRAAEDWKKRFPSGPRRKGRPSVNSAFVMHMVHQFLGAAREDYRQRKLSVPDQRARSAAQELVSAEVTGDGPRDRIPHRAEWVADIARDVAPKDGPRRHAQLVDRWVGYDWFWAWLPPRHGLQAHRLEMPQYHALVTREFPRAHIESVERRPLLYSLGDVDSINSLATYNSR